MSIASRIWHIFSENLPSSNHRDGYGIIVAFVLRKISSKDSFKKQKILIIFLESLYTCNDLKPMTLCRVRGSSLFCSRGNNEKRSVKDGNSNTA